MAKFTNLPNGPGQKSGSGLPWRLILLTVLLGLALLSSPGWSAKEAKPQAKAAAKAAKAGGADPDARDGVHRLQPDPIDRARREERGVDREAGRDGDRYRAPGCRRISPFRARPPHCTAKADEREDTYSAHANRGAAERVGIEANAYYDLCVQPSAAQPVRSRSSGLPRTGCHER